MNISEQCDVFVVYVFCTSIFISKHNNLWGLVYMGTNASQKLSATIFQIVASIAGHSKTLVLIYKTARHSIPEDRNIVT
jgi:hypothetical protein